MSKDIDIPAPPPSAWSWTSDGWTRLSPDGTRLEYGGDGPEPVEPVRVCTVGTSGEGPIVRLPYSRLPPVPRWRLVLRRWLRRGVV